MVYIGVDLGGTGIKCGVVDERGRLLSQAETPTLPERPYQEIVRDIAACSLRALEGAGLSLNDVSSVGVGIPGVANQQTGVVVFCTNLAWHDIPLRQELQKHIDRPVFIDNDATVAGLAESVAGVSAGCQTSVFLTLGTGVGSGIIIGGKVWNGAHGVAGELGHLPMDIEGEPCTCGNNGCIERYCSATAIIRMARQAVANHPESDLYAACGGDLSRIDAKMVIDAAREGDDVATKVFRRYINYLCMALDTVISFLDPEMIVLGGGVSRAGDFLLDAIRARLPRYIMYKTLPYAEIAIARLGADAGMIGAAMLGLER